jgi:hypothetical protein
LKDGIFVGPDIRKLLSDDRLKLQWKRLKGRLGILLRRS